VRIRNWTIAEHDYLRREVPKRALKTPFRDRTLREFALDVLEIATAGLKRRAASGGFAADESAFLDVLWEIARSGRTQAEALLDAYETRWGRKIEPVFSEFQY